MATNKIYLAEGTTIVWAASGGDYTFTPTSVTTAAGRIGARGDLGATPRARKFNFYAEAKNQGTPTVGAVIELYLARWKDTTDKGEGNVGSTDAAFATANNRLNLWRIGSLICENATPQVMVKVGTLEISHRYVSPIWWNATGATLSATAGDFLFKLTPVPDDIQASA